MDNITYWEDFDPEGSTYDQWIEADSLPDTDDDESSGDPMLEYTGPTFMEYDD